MNEPVSSRPWRWLPWLLGLSLLINAGFLGGFFYHRYVMGPPSEHLAQVERALKLNGDQQRALADIQREMREEARENFRVMRERHQELVVLLREDHIDMPALERHLRATTEPQVAMQRDLILRLLAFRDGLEPEQKQIFNEKIERPGFMLRLAGFAGPMWRGHDCRKKMLGSDRAQHEPPPPPPNNL